MLRFRDLAVAASACALLALGTPACGETEEPGVLQTQDLQAVEGVEAAFDRNNIVDTTSFEDVESLDAAIIQKFLHRNPYDRASFLETYQSNGVRAADAIAKAARTYRINPLVLLVLAQTTQGLIGETSYPFPPERVEYIFRCGCLQDANCVPELAGFDRQVDCLARSLRVALDGVKANGATASGWGMDVTSLTLDSLKVTPTTEATAVVYDHSPRVDQGKPGGSWIFWNVWNLYAIGIDYAGPIGQVPGGGWIGDACESETNCGIGEGAICARNYPDGLCTIKCEGDCPQEVDRRESFCADFKESGGYCLQVCNPGAPECRSPLKCVRLKRFGATTQEDSKYVCSLD